jgi:membrane-associated phospholipid phosphatase
MLEDKRKNRPSFDLKRNTQKVTNGPKKHVAVEKAEKALEKGFAEVQTPSDAAEALDKVEAAAGDMQEQDVPPEAGSANPVKQAEAVKAAADSATAPNRPAAVLANAAIQVAAAPPDKRGELDEAIGQASMPTTDESPRVRQGRSLLRNELLKRLKPFDAIDATLFIQINHLPHPKLLDRLISRFSWFMTGGHAWILLIAVNSLVDRRRAMKALGILPALYLATYTVELPIKRYFRRRRPFISIVRAIVVGRKPGSYSFPSGHSAAAFAGATLLQTCYPRARWPLFAVAALVAFSRVYLGAHYPGDVLSGGLAGAGLAKAYRALFTRLFRN